MSLTTGKPGVNKPRLNHDKSLNYIKEASRFIAGGVNSNVRLGGAPVPLCFRSAKGALLTDLDGNQYVDYAAGMGPTLLGHANEYLTTAVADSLQLGQLFAGQSELELALARRLQSIVPCAGLVRLGMSGSEMVQAAIRVARAHTGRPKCIKFEGHYHGWFDNVLLNLTAALDAGTGEVPIPPRVESKGQSPAAAEDMVILPWNDIDVLAGYLERHGHEVACILMEPVMCNSGVVAPAAGYLEGVRALCDRHEIVFVMDEVITGFRLSLEGAQGHFGVTPDIATYAKAFGGGFPVAAMAGRTEIMSQIGTGVVNHSGTYNANLVSLAAGVATLDLLQEDDGAVYRRIEEIGRTLMDGIRQISEDAGIPLQVQGYPSVFQTFFSENAAITCFEDLGKCDHQRLREFLELLQESGIRPTGRGAWFVTSAHDESLVDRTLEAVRQAVGFLQ